MGETNAASCVYEVFLEKTEIEGVGERDSYGIIARLEAGEKSLRVRDVTTERDTADKLAEICNSHAVAPEHFLEVLDDFWGSDNF